MLKNIKDDNMDLMIKCILEIKTPEECYDFLYDLCTVNEIKSISQRVMVAKMLRDKEVYNDIVKVTGASTATVSRVNRTLQYGTGAYETIFKRLDEKE